MNHLQLSNSLTNKVQIFQRLSGITAPSSHSKCTWLFRQTHKRTDEMNAHQTSAFNYFKADLTNLSPMSTKLPSLVFKIRF